MAKNISILGSTGSIGTQTLEVVRDLKNINVIGLTANTNIDLIEKQIDEFNPKVVAIMDEDKAKELTERVKGKDVEILSGLNGLVKVATLDEIDTVVTSVVGNIGLKPTYEAIKSGKDIALANKETLVSAGKLITDAVKEYNVKMYPVDSEHSAIFQSLQGNSGNKIRRILLTASGGPFRGKDRNYLKNVTVEQALNHPNWSMGRKITIDSASLMNKGLEVIEAKYLFDVDVKDIEVLIHPQSIVHSAVEYEDGAVMAQMGEPDMKVPIQYALTYPKRIKNDYPKVDFGFRNNLTFEKPDMDTFRCLSLAYKALEIGGTMTTVLNGANEVAVSRFLDNDIKFLEIAEIIEKTMEAHTVQYDYTIDDLLEADKWAKEYASKIVIK